MFSLLTSFVIPPWARILAIIAALAALFGYGWLKGCEHEESKQATLNAKIADYQQGEIVRLARAASEIEVVWVNTTSTIHDAAKVLHQEVPKYVTAQADHNCTLTRGLLDLWNSPLQTHAAPTAAAGSADAPAGLAFGQFADRGIIEAKERFDVNRAALTACQIYVQQINPMPRSN